jgi:hypothetical protein
LQKARDIIEQILKELQSIQVAPFPKSGRGEVPEIPGWISAGNGDSLIINRAISELIVELAGLLLTARPQLANAISGKDWGSIVQRAIGPILAEIDLDMQLAASAQLALIALNGELDQTKWNFKKRTFLFGCSLIEHHEIPPFTVGPVTISRRNIWLDAALAEGRITPVTHRRLTARWSGKKVRRRKGSVDSANEADIFETVGEAPFICSVQTDGLFGSFAKEKALLVARIAVVGVALMWVSPRNALRDINFAYDGPSYIETYVFYQNRPESLGGRRRARSFHGLTIFKDTWEPLVAKRADWWATLAETIEFLLGDPAAVRRPKLMNSFAHALIWFHEACREPMPMIAITKFMSCLDALACGKGGGGIMTLISARTGVEPTTPIRKDGQPYKVVVNELYSQGRSRLLHGNSDRLGRDWEDLRGLAETLARRCLIHCFHWAARHSESDDPQQMSVAD